MTSSYSLQVHVSYCTHHTKKKTYAETQQQVNYRPSKEVFALLLAEGPQLFSHLLFCERTVSITGAKTETPVG